MISTTYQYHPINAFNSAFNGAFNMLRAEVGKQHNTAVLRCC